MRLVSFLLVLPITIAFAADNPVDRALDDANALYRANKRDEAKAAFAKILENAPNNGEANYRLGMYAVEAGDWEPALKFEEKALAANPTSAAYQYGWGAANGVAAMRSSVFSKLGYAKKCLAAYQRAVELDPKTTQYRFGLMAYYLQAPGFVGGDIKAAYAQAAEIKKLNAEQGRQAYIQVYLADKKYDDAFHEFDGVLTQTPPDYRALYSYGRLTLMTAQHLDEGLQAFRLCLDRPSDATFHPPLADLHWRIGSVFERMGKLPEARAEYALALKEDPKHRPTLQSLQKLPAAPAS